jgi:DNA-binding NarL/FixJ family response regulator
VGEAATGREAIDQAEALRPDVVLLDIRMPVMDGVKAAERLATQCKVMMLTYSDDEPMVAGAIRAGAHGYLVHGRFEPDELTRAVRDLAGGKRIVSPSVAPVIFELIARGESHDAAPARDSGPDALTGREREVMTSISRGRSNRDIATELVISEKTVKNHIRAIYDKLGVGSRAEAMAVWLGIEREERRG